MPARVLIRRILLAASALAGAFGGPSALASAMAARPPMTWGDLAFACVGTLVGLPLVLGFQALLGNYNALRLGWLLFLYGAAYCTTSGVAALVIAARGPGLTAPAFLFLTIGLAMLAGIAVVRVVFKRRFPPH